MEYSSAPYALSYPLGAETESKASLSSAAVRVRAGLLKLILDGKIRAGVRLDQRILAKQLATTTGPLREAMSTLEAEGFLVRKRGLGVFCRIYTVLEFEEMVAIRGVLESLAANRAAKRITDEDVAELRERAAVLAQPIPPGGDERFVASHVDFHKRIVQISRSPRLQELLGVQHLIDDVLANIAANLWRAEPHDHMGLVDALASHDPERAEAAMRAHIAPTYEKRFAALRARFGESFILSGPDEEFNPH